MARLFCCELRRENGRRKAPGYRATPLGMTAIVVMSYRPMPDRIDPAKK
jgi:hypothetical protein